MNSLFSLSTTAILYRAMIDFNQWHPKREREKKLVSVDFISSFFSEKKSFLSSCLLRRRHEMQTEQHHFTLKEWPVDTSCSFTPDSLEDVFLKTKELQPLDWRKTAICDWRQSSGFRAKRRHVRFRIRKIKFGPWFWHVLAGWVRWLLGSSSAIK